MSTLFISHSSKDDALARDLAGRLAGQGHRSVFLDVDPEQGIVAGRSWEQTLYRKLRACRAVLALCTDHFLGSRWCFAEVALARMEGKRVIVLQADPLSDAAELPAILTDRQFVDLRNGDGEGYRRLWRGLADLERFGPEGDWNPEDPPYLGLDAYQEEHAPVFFGREDEVREGLELLDRGAPSLILVLGASGSGKSSLVRAGILPELRRQADWLIVDPFRPGRDPHLELVESLIGAWRRHVPGPPADTDLRESLRSDLESWTPGAGPPPLVELAEDLQRATSRRDARVLLIVDQFEELLERDDEDRRADRFLALLRATLEVDRSPVMALVTLRSDFLEALQQNAALQGVDFASLSLGPMPVEGMRRVIEEPARLGEIELERGLADRLLEDTGTPDALPLLSFTLWVLWRDYRDDGKLEIDEYKALGGLQGAVTREADALLDSATRQGDRDALRQAFLRLARLTEEGRFARRPVLWKARELVPVHDHLERFIARRLLRSRGDRGDRVVEVTHEALFRSWKPLRGWLDNNRAELLLRQQLSRDAETWNEHDRSAEHLWRGGRLQQALELRRRQDLEPLEDAFVRAGQRRQQVRRWALAGITTAVILILAGFLFYALAAADRAEKARAESQNLARAAIAPNLLESDPLRANVLLLEVEDPEMLPSAMAALHKAPTVPLKMLLGQGAQHLMAHSFNRDGTFLAVFNLTDLEEVELTIWDTRSGRRFDKRFGPWMDSLAIAFSPTQDHLFLAGDGSISLWDIRSEMPVSTFQPPALDGDVVLARYSDDGDRILVLNSDGDVLILDSRSGSSTSPAFELPTSELELDGALYEVTPVPLHFDGGRLLLRKSETQIGLWDLPSGERTGTFEADSKIHASSLSAGGVRILDQSQAGRLQLTDLSSGLERLGTYELGDQAEIVLARFNHDGTRAVVALKDGEFYILDFRALPEISGVQLERSYEFDLEGGIDEPTIFFTASGSHVLNFSAFEKLTGIWDIETGELVMAVPGLPTAVSPDGSQVATYRKTSGDFKSGELFPLYLWKIPISTELTGKDATGCRGCETPLATASPEDGPESETTSPDSRFKARAEKLNDQQVVQVVNARTEEILWTRPGSQPRFSDDSRYLITVGAVTATVWEAASGRRVAFLEGHDAAIEEAFFSPDSRWALTVGEDDTAQLWHVDSGNPITRLPVGDGAVAFSPDGSRLVTGSGDERRTWAISADLLKALIGSRTNLCLEPEFREQRLGETREEAWRKFERCEGCQGRCAPPAMRVEWLGESAESAEDGFRSCQARLAEDSPQSAARTDFEASWERYRSCMSGRP